VESLFLAVFYDLPPAGNSKPPKAAEFVWTVRAESR